MTTIADFKKLFEGLPDDTPILVQNSECVISDCSPFVEVTTFAGDESYYWHGVPDEDELHDAGYDSNNVIAKKAIWINGEEP